MEYLLFDDKGKIIKTFLYLMIYNPGKMKEGGQGASTIDE